MAQGPETQNINFAGVFAPKDNGGGNKGGDNGGGGGGGQAPQEDKPVQFIRSESYEDLDSWEQSPESSAPEAQHTYWRDLQASYQSDPNYQDPVGYGRDFVDIINVDLDRRSSGFGNIQAYREDDPTYGMIRSYTEELNAKRAAESAEPVGQTGEAYQEQPQPEAVQAEAPQQEAPAPEEPQMKQPGTIHVEAGQGQDQNGNKFTAILEEQSVNQSTPAPEAPAESASLHTGQEEPEEEVTFADKPVYDELLNTYLGMGMEESMAKELALADAREQVQAKEYETEFTAKDVDWGGLADVTKTAIQQDLTNLVYNTRDIIADIMGRDPETGAPVRYNYFELADEGYDYYNDSMPMSAQDYAKKYAEYKYREQTGERWDASIDLTDFAQYMPEGTTDLAGVKLTGSRDVKASLPANPVNADRGPDPQMQELSSAIEQYINTGTVSDTPQTQSSSAAPAAPVESKPMTAQEYDQAIIALIEANPTDALADLINIDTTGSIENMDSLFKQLAFYGLPTTGSSDVEGADPTLEKLGHPFVQTAMSAGIMGSIGEIAGTAIGGPVAGRAFKVVGLMIGFGIPYSEQVLGYKIPYYDEAMEFFDKGADAVETAYGKFALAYENALGAVPFEDAGKVYRDLKNAFKYSDVITAEKQKLEDTWSDETWAILGPYSADLGVNIDNSRYANTLLNVGVAIDTARQGGDVDEALLKSGSEVYRYNLGQAEKQTIAGTPAERFMTFGDTLELMAQYGVSKEAREQWIAEKVGNLMGTNAFVNESIYNEMGDPLNLVEGQTANFLYGVGNITGDTNLQTAAIAGGAGLNPMDYITAPGMDTVATSLGKLIGQEWHKSDGFTEIANTYNIENQFGNLDNVTDFGKRFSGITKEGKLAGLDPTAKKGLTPYETLKNKIVNFFSKTDETRVLYLTDISNTFINSGLAIAGGDPVKIQAFLEQLKNPDLITPDNPLYDLSQSAAFNTFQEDLADSVNMAQQNLDSILSSWNKFADNRRILNALSEALGVKPERIIDLAESDKYNLLQMIRQKAEKNGGKLPGIDIDVNDPGFSDNVMNKLAPFVKTEKNEYRTPWNTQELTFQISNAIGDGMQSVMLDKYNIQPNHVVFRFADSIKAGQNIVFLGISGTYLMNNILNNVVTRGSVGVGGFSPINQINKYFQRMGIRSERFGDNLAQEIGAKSSGEQTQYTRMQEAISKRKEVKGFLNSVKKFAGDVNRVVGVFGNLSGKVEEMESKQAVYAGTKTYIDRTWKPGVNLTAMPSELIAALEAQSPGISSAIYSAIQNSLSMGEVNDAVLGDFIDPGVKQIFLDIAEEHYGPGAGDIVGQLLDKTGMLDRLQAELKGKDEAGREKVFRDFVTRVEAEVNRKVAEQVVDKAEEIRNQVRLGGFKEAVQAASMMVDADLQTKLGASGRWSALFTYRLREPMTAAQWRAEVQNLQNRIKTIYQQVDSIRLQTYDGILTGLGMDDTHKQEYIDALGATRTAWTDFYAQQDAEFAKYREAAAPQAGEDKAAWQARAKAAWQTYQENMAPLYDQVSAAEMEQQDRMDKAFSEGLKEAYGTSEGLEFIDELQAQIREVRTQQIELIKEIRRQERTLDHYDQRDKLWKSNEAKNTGFNNEIARLQKQLFAQIKEAEADMIGISPDVNKPNWDAILKADIAHEEAVEMKTAAEKYADRAWEKLSTDGVTFRPEFLHMENMPTVEECEALFDEIQADKHFEGKYADELLAFIYANAGFDVETNLTSLEESLFNKLSKEQLHKIFELGNRYDAGKAMEMRAFLDANDLAVDIANRVYPGVYITDSEDQSQWDYAHQIDERRDELYYNLRLMAYELARFGKTVTPDIFSRVQNEITPQDWFTINAYAQNYNPELFHLNNPDAPAVVYHTEQVDPYKYGVYTITSKVMYMDKVIALVPDEMPVTELHYDQDISFPVIGIDPENPEAIVYQAGDDVRKLDPKAFDPEPNEAESTAYKPALDVDKAPCLDPLPMAEQEITYKDTLPLIEEVARKYEDKMKEASYQKISNLDPVTRQMVKSYLDNVVAKDMASMKYKSLRYGEMMRDAALLNYSERYGFDNFLTAIAPYQFWITRSMNNWMKRMLDHPRLYSHYYRLKEMEERNERDFFPSRLAGKIGIPMPGWPAYMGGRVFFNPAQLQPINNILGGLESLDDDKHVAEQKTMTQLNKWLEDGTITQEEYDEAKTKTGPWWDSAYAEVTLGQDLDPSFGSLWNSYMSPMLPVSWLKAYMDGKGDKLSHFPSTNVGNSVAQMISRTAPENETVQSAAQIVRDTLSAPERALRDLFGFEYNEFGAFGDSLISRRLRAMLTDGEISKDEWRAAWMEKDGNPIYDQAVEDVRQEQALRVPMMGAVSGIEDLFKNGDVPLKDRIANVILQVCLSPFGEYVYSEGERKQREVGGPEKTAAFEAYKNGDKDALNRFYDKYPAEQTWSITNKPTEEAQQRQLLYQTITDVYFDLDDVQQQDVRDALGDKFYDAVINKETRNIDEIPLEDLAAYARALNGTLPYAQAPALKGLDIPEKQVSYTPDPVREQINEYYETKKRDYPGISVALDYYHKLEWKDQLAFKQAFPPVAEYLDWNNKWKDEHPLAAAWLDRKNQNSNDRNSAEVWTHLDNVTRGVIIDSAATGQELPLWANAYIEQAWKASGIDRKVTADNMIQYAKRNKLGMK